MRCNSIRFDSVRLAVGSSQSGKGISIEPHVRNQAVSAVLVQDRMSHRWFLRWDEWIRCGAFWCGASWRSRCERPQPQPHRTEHTKAAARDKTNRIERNRKKTNDRATKALRIIHTTKHRDPVFRSGSTVKNLGTSPVCPIDREVRAEPKPNKIEHPRGRSPRCHRFLT